MSALTRRDRQIGAARSIVAALESLRDKADAIDGFPDLVRREAEARLAAAVRRLAESLEVGDG